MDALNRFFAVHIPNFSTVNTPQESHSSEAMSFSMDRQAALSQQFDTSLKHLSQQTSSSFLIAPKID